MLDENVLNFCAEQITNFAGVFVDEKTASSRNIAREAINGEFSGSTLVAVSYFNKIVLVWLELIQA